MNFDDPDEQPMFAFAESLAVRSANGEDLPTPFNEHPCVGRRRPTLSLCKPRACDRLAHGGKVPAGSHRRHAALRHLRISPGIGTIAFTRCLGLLATSTSPIASERVQLLRDPLCAMLLDRLRNGRSFASIHPGNLHLSQCGEKYITSRIALRFAGSAFRFRHPRKFGFQLCASRRNRIQIAFDFLRPWHRFTPLQPIQSLRTAITIRAIIQHRNRYTTSVRGVTKSDREWTRKGAGLTPRRRQNELRFGFTLRAPKTQCACWRSVQQGVAIDRSSDQADDPYRGSSRQPIRHRQSNERCRLRCPHADKRSANVWRG
ncbi:hypothetical protein FG95_00929 [Sphingopyxis sp. LC363]|nr:hypothetical protein FG95_00929 [Sphingopyxis sp. LC363]